MSNSGEFIVSMPSPTEEQILALNGLATAFGWNIKPVSQEDVPYIVTDAGNSNEGTPEELSGPVVVKDASFAIIESDTDEMAARVNATQEIINRSEQILTPLNTAFAYQVPGTEANGGGILSRRKIGKELYKTWRYVGANKDIVNPLIYDFALTYVQGKQANSIKTVAVDIKTEKEERQEQEAAWRKGGTPRLELKFDEVGEVVQINLSCKQRGSMVLTRILEGTDLGDVMDRLGYSLDEGFSKDISIDIQNGVFVYDQEVSYATPDRGRNYQSVHLKSEYRVNRALDGQIQRFSTSTDRDWRIAETDRSKKVGSSISVEEYLQIIKDLMSLIPLA